MFRKKDTSHKIAMVSCQVFSQCFNLTKSNKLNKSFDERDFTSDPWDQGNL